MILFYITLIITGMFFGFISERYISILVVLIMSSLLSIVVFIGLLIFGQDEFFAAASTGLACLGSSGIITIFAIEKQEKPQPSKADDNIHSPAFDSYYVGDKCISLYARKGYSWFPIAGAYYRNLPITMVGKFDGYATTDSWNEYDKYAIEIYTNRGVHVGFVPRGNLKLHAYILDNKNKVHAYGYIGMRDSGSMYGQVCVESDKTLVRIRNKPYAVVDHSTNPSTPNT